MNTNKVATIFIVLVTVAASAPARSQENSSRAQRHGQLRRATLTTAPSTSSTARVATRSGSSYMQKKSTSDRGASASYLSNGPGSALLGAPTDYGNSYQMMAGGEFDVDGSTARRNEQYAPVPQELLLARQSVAAGGAAPNTGSIGLSGGLDHPRSRRGKISNAVPHNVDPSSMSSLSLMPSRNLNSAAMGSTVYRSPW